jgi:Tfp pilus assembly protein PilX
VSVFLGSAAAQPLKPGPSPCALVTKAEVQAAVGSPVSEGVINKTNKSVCDFKIGDAGSALNIMLTPKGPADSAEAMVAGLKKQKISAEVTSGFGDSAYASSPGYGMQQLGVYKGSNHVIVTVLVFGAPEAKSKTVAQTVMRKALSRL